MPHYHNVFILSPRVSFQSTLFIFQPVAVPWGSIIGLFFTSIYTLFEIINSHKLNYHFYRLYVGDSLRDILYLI